MTSSLFYEICTAANSKLETNKKNELRDFVENKQKTIKYVSIVSTFQQLVLSQTYHQFISVILLVILEFAVTISSKLPSNFGRKGDYFCDILCACDVNIPLSTEIIVLNALCTIAKKN